MIARLAVEASCDHTADAFLVSHHIFRREAQDCEAATRQIVVANGIVALRNIRMVGDAVDFDDQARMQTGKIDNVAADPDLLTEVEAIDAKGME